MIEIVFFISSVFRSLPLLKRRAVNILCRYHTHSARFVIVFYVLLIDAVLASSKTLFAFYYKQQFVSSLLWGMLWVVSGNEKGC